MGFSMENEFNAETSKQAQDVIFTRKFQKKDYLPPFPHYILMTVPWKKPASKSILEFFWILG